jgi:hypothetical protein
MEPSREEQKALEAGAEQKPRRFRIVKLEERIAPAKAGGTNGPKCYSHQCTMGCSLLLLPCGQSTSPSCYPPW